MKGLLSETPSVVNVLTSTKILSNLQETESKTVIHSQSQILELLVNTLSTEYKYSSSNRQLSITIIINNYLKNKNIFLNFLFQFWNGHLIRNILKKKSLIAQIVLKLLTPKKVLTEMHKRSCFQKLFCREVLTSPRNC